MHAYIWIKISANCIAEFQWLRLGITQKRFLPRKRLGIFDQSVNDGKNYCQHLYFVLKWHQFRSIQNHKGPKRILSIIYDVVNCEIINYFCQINFVIEYGVVQLTALNHASLGKIWNLRLEETLLWITPREN